MKNRLRFVALLIILILIMTTAARGQGSIFTEEFSGFTTGSHSTPSTSDASSTLNTKTTVPGWSGTYVYSAGGEIKLGTSSNAGWIETPVIDLSSTGGNFTIRFDIARWPGDATTVQVYFNDTEKGSVITPADEYQRITIQCTGESLSGKIKFKGLTKRFFLDNLSIDGSGVTTGISFSKEMKNGIRVYPVPCQGELKVETDGSLENVEILDISGRLLTDEGEMSSGINSINTSGLPAGIYLLRCRNGKKIEIIRFIKTGK